jgi:hypothetical protein
MLRLVYVETLVTEADSVEEAHKIAASRGIPAGLSLLSEQTIADPPESVGAIADTLEEARAELHRKLPPGAQILSERVISTPERRTISVEAPDEWSAKDYAKKEMGGFSPVSIRESPGGYTTHRSLLDVTATRLLSTGKKGFLGIGKAPRQYEVELIGKGCVEISYSIKPKLIRKVGVRIESAEKLQFCMRRDNLNPHEDFDQSVRELKAESRIGSLALAKLIRECLNSRCSEITWALAAAREAEPTQELLEALRSALSAKQMDSYDGGQSSFTPELFGERKIGWTDGTFQRLKDIAIKSLEELLRSTTSGQEPDVVQGSVIIACAQCTEPASYKLDDELLCPKHHRQNI